MTFRAAISEFLSDVSPDVRIVDLLTRFWDRAVAAERERILKLLRAESGKWFHVGETHSNADVRRAAMEECAAWNKSISLLEAGFQLPDESVSESIIVE